MKALRLAVARNSCRNIAIAPIEQQSNLLTFVDEDARTKEVKLRKNEKPLP